MGFAEESSIAYERERGYVCDFRVLIRKHCLIFYILYLIISGIIVF